MNKFLIGLILLFIPACATLEKPNPDSFNDKFVYAVATANIVTKSTVDLYQRGSLPREEAEKIAEALTQVDELLFVAKTAHTAGNKDQATSTLNTVTEILLKLEAQLKGAQNGQPERNSDSQSYLGSSYSYS